MGLPSLLTTDKVFSFRLHTGRQIIDIYTDNDQLYGSITSYVTEVSGKKRLLAKRTFSQCLLLTEEQLKSIKQCVDNSGIYDIPSYEDIEGWRVWADGSYYRMEYATADHYYFKSYWSPESQSLPVAKNIKQAVDCILLLADATAAWNCMARDIPFDCYSWGSGEILSIILPKKEKRALRNKRRIYVLEGRIR